MTLETHHALNDHPPVSFPAIASLPVRPLPANAVRHLDDGTFSDQRAQEHAFSTP
jgi:hypothetical protein